MKKFLFFFLFNILFFHQMIGRDSLAVDINLDKNWCASVTSDIGSWIEGYQMGDDVLSVYLNVTSYEFQDFLELNNTDALTLRLFWRSNSGNQIRREADYTIDSLEPDFDIRNWTATHEPADLEGGYYVAQVLIGDNTCSEFIPIIMMEDIEEEEEPLPIELPAYNCGDEFTLEETEESNLASAESGDVFLISGFPILLKSVEGGNGNFSGTGIIPLPFDRKVVSVEFANVHVNENRRITSGEVVAKGDDPENYPNFNPDTDVLNIGGEICIPPPETPGYENGVDENGLDPRGFDPTTAVHNETGTNFDPYGFDINGNYQDGTPYNQCGCSIEGLTENNEVCDVTCGPNPASEAFAESLANDLPNQITTLINLLIAENLATLTALGCPQIRSDMETLNTTTLGYDPVFVFGEDNKYISEDMHLHFTERPKPLPITINTRDPNAVMLENKHVELFDCDKKAYAVRAYIETLNFLNEQAQKDAFVEATLTKIRGWTEYMLNLMNGDGTQQPGESEEFNNWLTGEIGQYMMDNSGLDPSYHNLFVDQSIQEKDVLEDKIKSIFDFNQRGMYNDVASTESSMAFDEAFTLEDASFLFRQGHQKINGVDRAFYLEELAKKQNLVASDEVSSLMPIVVDKTVGNKTYTIYLDQIVFSTSGARVDAFLIITDAESGKRIIFKGLNIGFGPTGLRGESRLSLESEVEIRLNNSAMLVLNPSGETFVEWDCEGFVRMGVDAGVEFCRDFITPLDPTSLDPVEDEEVRYKFDIVTVIDSWLEFNITLPGGTPFAVTKYEDIKWQFSNVILDFSSSSTADFQPPEGFTSPHYDGSQMSDLWKGVYIESLSVQFPNSFSSGEEPITASASNVLIDGGGFSGGLSVENLISIESGNLGGWPFSIDHFHLKILNNQYAGAGMGGEVNVPIFTENLEYRAAVYPDNEYHFSVITQSDLTANVFVASVTLEENSAIDVSYVEGEFTAIATLNGSMEINTANNPNASFDLKLPKVSFQDFQISNKPNYFHAGNWGLDTNGGPIASVGFNGFGIKLHGVKPYSIEETGAGVEFDLEVKLVDTDKVGVGARGVFGVEGELIIDDENRQSWEFDRVKLNTLLVDTHFPGVKKLKGFVEWYEEDPNFGEGFRGAMELELDKLGVGIEAVGQFGKLESGHKYFFVDALAKFGSLAPSIGVMKFTGFGGGVSYGMDINQSNSVTLENAPNANDGIVLPPLGTALSGTIYTPNPEAGLGIKAVVSLATQQEEIFNGTVGLTFEFTNTGSIHEITLFGSGQFLEGYHYAIQPEISNGTIPASKPSTVTAALSAYIDLNINFTDNTLDGELTTYLNAGLVTGVGDQGRFVTAQLHFSDEDWYIYIGTPDAPTGIAFNLPFVNGSQGLQATAYLDIGTVVPAMPDLPSDVREIAYKINDNQSLRQSGSGFIFGAALNLQVNVSMGVASAEVRAGVGFDLALRKYNNLVCSETQEPVGIDGWYATGQMWAFATGELNAFGVNILSVGVAAVLQARLPNPFFAQATVGVRVKLGPFKANKSLSIKIGNDCTLVSDSEDDLVGIDVIPYIDPTTGADEVETSSVITAFPVIPLNKKIEITTLDGELKEYKATLSESILKDENGNDIPHASKYNSQTLQLDLVPTSYLPGDQNITAIFIVEIKEGYNHVAFQSDTTIFKTASPIGVIPEKNIVYSYPVKGMNNFYPGENPNHNGFIKLDRYQQNIVSKLESNSFIRFTDNNDNIKETPVSFDYLTNTIEFNIEENLLNNGTIYKMEVVGYTVPHIIANSNTNNGPSAFSLTSQEPNTVPVYRLASGGLLQLAIQGSVGNIETPNTSSNVLENNGSISEEVFYTTYFRVSNYNNVSAKINEISNNTTAEWNVRSVSNESFDRVEIEGIQGLPKLVSINSNLNPEYSFIVKRELYDAFPIESNPINGYGPICKGMVLNYNEIGDNTNYLDYAGIVGPLNSPLTEEQFFDPATFNPVNPEGPQILLNDIENQMTGDNFGIQANLNICIQEGIDNYEDEPGNPDQLRPPGVIINSSNIDDYYPYNRIADEYEDEVLDWYFQIPSPISSIFPLNPTAPYRVDVKYTLPNGEVTSINSVEFQK